MNLPQSSEREPVRFQWEFNWKVCAFAALFLPILTGLGFWQLDRASHKRTLAQSFAAGQAGEPVPFARIKSGAKLTPYQRVTITGQFDAQRYWLKDNAIWQGRAGYDVIMPFHSQSGDTVLINRGWVAGTGYRDLLPHVETPQSPITVSGTLTEPSPNPLLKNPEVSEHADWPRLIIAVNVAQSSAQLDTPVWPQMLHIAPESPAALQTHWQPMRMTEARHKGYAVQWFSMAAFLLLLTVLANSNLIDYLRYKYDGK